MGARSSHVAEVVDRQSVREEVEEEAPVQPEDRFQLSDRDRAGCLYVISTTTTTTTSSTPARGSSPVVADVRARHSVVVDVSGESNDWLLVGKELSVELDEATSRIRYVFSHGKGRWPLDRLVTWRHLGRVPLPPDLFAASCHPDIWSAKLDMLASELYTQMLKELGRRDWPGVPSLLFAERLAALLLQEQEQDEEHELEDESLPAQESPKGTKRENN